MILKDAFTYLDSETCIIHDTPCEICGSKFEIDALYFENIYGNPHHLCICKCTHCSNEKVFLFSAPYLREDLVVPPDNLIN